MALIFSQSICAYCQEKSDHVDITHVGCNHQDGFPFGSQDKTIKLWSLPDGKLLRTLKSHTAGVYSLAFSAEGTSLASGSADGTVKLWRIR